MQFRSITLQLTIALIVVFVAALVNVQADQILTVINPTNLASQFPNGITERPALFGFPSYGGSITGYVTYDMGNTTGCKGLAALDPLQSDNAIYLVDRGNCTFVTKVRNAENVGARAVIVVDNVPNEVLPFMADDGTGSDIEIPSVMISYVDGSKIKSHLEVGDVVQVVMEWKLPNKDERVEMDIWTSSSARDPTFSAFKKNFATVAKALGNSLYVEPHYYTINGTGRCTRNDQPCGTQCIMNGRYCAADPEMDLSKGLTGADVVIENLRQLCVYKLLNGTNNTLLWWSYVQQFEMYCSKDEHTWTGSCVTNILTALNLREADVTKCMADAGGTTGNGYNKILDEQIQMATERGVFIIPTITINTIPYRGSTYCPSPVSQEHCGVFQAVCSGYDETYRPNACIPGCPIDNPNCNASTSSSGVSVGVVVAIVIAALVLAAGVTFFFIRRQQKKMKDDLDSILQSYMPIGDERNRRGEAQDAPLVQIPSASDEASNQAAPPNDRL